MKSRALVCLTFAVAAPIFAQVAEPQPSVVSLPIPPRQEVPPPLDPPRHLRFVSDATTQSYIAKFQDNTGVLTNSHISDDASGVLLSGAHFYLNAARTILMYPALQGYGNDVSGMMAGSQTLGVGFNSEGTFTGTVATMSGRQMYFADFQAGRLRGAIDSSGTWWFGTSPTNYTLRVLPPMAGTVTGVMINEAGRVGMGMPPDAFHRLKVSGDAHFAGKVTGQNIQAHYQDVAEWVPAAEDLVPGTVVVLDQRADNTVKASDRPYDTMVAGVVSAQPGLILGEAAATKEQIATTGRVRVKVDASRGGIAIGDILVTGTVAGTAMKSTPVEVAGIAMHRPGTIIGKALEPLADGVGEILVLLSLQ